MDPQQAAVYTKAHTDLQELFREIARDGRITAVELQNSLLSYTAGDSRRDLEELIEDMKHKQSAYDEPEFIRVMWKKFYLSNLMYSERQMSASRRRPASGGHTRHMKSEQPVINIPFEHVIVSIKRRSQLKQFAHYYTSRGISGADHLNADKGNVDSRSARHFLHEQRKRQQATVAAALSATIVALREQTAPAYDVVCCIYDPSSLSMKTHTVFSSITDVHVRNASRLHCLLFSEDVGNLALGSHHFIHSIYTQASRLEQEELQGQDSGILTDRSTLESKPFSMQPVPSLTVLKLDDFGLRNIVGLGVGRGVFTVTTERRVHHWNAFAPACAKSKQGDSTIDHETPLSLSNTVLDFLEDEGDCFGMGGGILLSKRSKTVTDLVGVQNVVCGDRFAIGVVKTSSNSSELYAWGSTLLGGYKETPTKLPFFIEAPVLVQHLACGLQHALLQTSTGVVFSWGSNVHGQLGHGGQCTVLDAPTTEPKLIELSSVQALDIACGDHHSVVLTDKGGIMTFGNNWYGQLGLDPTTTDTGSVPTPTRVMWWTHHSDGGSSDLSIMESKIPSSPKKVQTPRAYLISAIGDTTAMVTEDGDVYVWGKCISPHAHEGVCGIISQWMPQKVMSHSKEQNGKDENNTKSLWCGLAITNGLIVLTKCV